MINLQSYNFRSIEFWKASIMTLPDNAFFELVRTVFGKVKTPFNKQILASDLEKFLLRSDIQKNIAGYIGKHDARIVAAVALLNEPRHSDMVAFFSGEFSYTELDDLLVNLEERFILYRFQDEDKSQNAKRLALNPVFKSILSPFIADNSLLFPAIHTDKMPLNKDHEDADPFDENFNEKNLRSPFIYDDRILAILLSFVSMGEPFFKAKGEVIRQKVLNSAKAMFPNLSLEILIGGLRALGMFSVKGKRIQPDYKRFSAFGKLSRQERAEYYTAGIFCYWEIMTAKKDTPSKEDEASENSSSDTISPWLLRTKIRYHASFIHRFCGLLDPNMLYPFATMQKLAYILELGNSEICTDRLIEVMEETGLLVSVSDKYWRRRSFTSPPIEGAVLAMDTPFSLMVYPEIEYNDLVMIAAFCNVTEAGLNVRFELNRDSVVSAFNLGISATLIIELLQRLSQNKIDENLIYALHDWERSHQEVTLRQGLVLTLSPERQYLAETKPLSTFITKTLAPGIYMLPATLEDRVVRTLHKAGVSIIARQSEHSDENIFQDNNKSTDMFSANFYPPLRAANISDKIFPHVFSQDEKPDENMENDSPPSALIENFHSMLNKMRVDKEKHDELAARIDRRLILCESQLKDAVLRYEKLEARGLDYAGKSLIAKQAISLQSLVEVVWPSKQKQERVLGIPKALEKAGSETYLVVKLINEEGGTVEIPLGKISLLRRVKKSIFESNIV